MSIAILPISQQFQWTSTTIGLVQSSFFWGYLLTQVGSPGVLLASSTCCLCQSASLQQPTGSFDAQLPPDQCTLRGSSACTRAAAPAGGWVSSPVFHCF